MCVSVFVVGVCVFHGYTCVCFHEHLCECGYWMLILDVFLYNSLCYVLRQVLWLHAKLNSSSNLDNQCIPKGSMPTFGELYLSDWHLFSAFIWILEIQTLSLTFTQQISYPRSHISLTPSKFLSLTFLNLLFFPSIYFPFWYIMFKVRHT